MKKVYSIFVCLCMLSGFVACDKDKDFALTTLSVTNETVTPSYETAEVSCSFKADATISEAYVQYSLSSSFADYEVAKMTEEKGRYTALLTGLVDNTTYYIRYTVSNKFSNVVADAVEEFQTLSCTVPTIVLDSIGGVRESHAKAYLHLSFDGGASVTDMGICWSTEASPTIEDIHKSTKDTVAVLDITDLQENTKYYVRAYAVNKVGTAYSEEVSFTTSKQVVLPTITTAAVTQITETTAVAGGNVTSDGGASVTERGVVYSTNPNPVITNLSNTIRPCGSGMGEFTYTITGLQPSTKYYVRAYAKNDAGTAYGEEVSFTTLSQQPTTQLPTVTTSVATQITATTAVAGGNVTSEGGASVTERGVCIATISNPTTANTKIPAGSGIGEFTCEITGLQEGTKYYIRAYAVNSEGTAYGEEEEFTTAVVTTPTLTTSEVTQITETSAVAGGNVTSDGNANVTERGVVYSLSATPAINDLSSTIVRSGSGTGVFTCNLTNLQSGTKYFVRAYAVNDKGTAYGEVVSFTTAVPITLATVTTATVSNITENTAVAGGAVTNDGNASVTDRGVCIATVSNPTTAHTKISAGSGMGTFTCNLTGLQASTKYYIRAYAVNSKGTSYGEELTFTTAKPIVLPTVTTDIVTQISVRTAVAGGNVTSDGNASVTERGVCVATASNPTTSNTKITSGSGTGSFTCNLTGLQPSTTYYVRAYAINSKGTAYGEEVSFTTEEQSSTPNDGTENGYAYVDLGLSVMWGVHNIGADFLEDPGDYFAWGETEPKEVYDWSTYKWCDGSYNTQTKYNSNYLCGIVDNKTYLEPLDDAAHVNWGGNWRMPTVAELKELDNCTWVYTQVNGVNGYEITGPNGNSIFLPVGEIRRGGEIIMKAVNFWLSRSKSSSANCRITGGDVSGTIGSWERYNGLNIRPVWREMELATLTTGAIGSLGDTITIEGSITNDGGAPVTEYGIVYDISPLPTISNSKLLVGSGIDSITFIGKLIDLQPGTTYYARAYAINHKGVAYGEEVSFTTKISAIATIVTTPATNVSSTSVTVGGNVTDDGGLDVTERGVVYSTNQNPTTADSKVTSGSGVGSFTCNLTGLQPSTTYYVRAYAINSKGTAYGEEVSFTTEEQSSTPNNGTENGHEYVDLGLSVKWATMNVGASSPEEYGDYFAWGETSTKSTYDWSTYKYCNGNYDSLTKYNTSSSYGTVDNKTTLELSDDAAHVNWGGAWRMPTYAEMTELREQCTWTWTSQNGVNGYKVTSKSNGNSIFLPAAGYRFNSSLRYAGSDGYYRSSSLYDHPLSTWDVDFDSSSVYWGISDRANGLTVRPVCP